MAEGLVKVAQEVCADAINDAAKIIGKETLEQKANELSREFINRHGDPLTALVHACGQLFLTSAVLESFVEVSVEKALVEGQ